jgi:exoribonuclease R
VHAIVTPCESDKGKGSLQKAILIQNLGKPSEESELQVLLANYAFDCKKKLRASASSAEAREASAALTHTDADTDAPRQEIKGYTFNIDPPGCRDVDDSFTFLKTGTTWQVSINIADVSAWVQEGSSEDLMAMERATSFYSTEGECLVPMFPRHISEGVASLGGDGPKPALSLQFTYDPSSLKKHLSDFKWIQSTVTKTRSYTYDEANVCSKEELLALKELTNSEDSHEWVERMMILYNEKAGEALKARGILRSHSAPQAQELQELVEIDPALAFLAYESATFVLPTEDTRHFGLNSAAYAYASSPIRRYCDVVNQRALKGILKTPITQDLIDSLNRRQKQAKAFSRDLFFMTQLSSNNCESVEGTIIDSKKVYVPVWKRCVKVRNLDLHKGTKVRLQWFEDREKPNWKERIVFRLDA